MKTTKPKITKQPNPTKAARLTASEVRKLQLENPNALRHLGGSFLVRAGLPLVRAANGFYGAHVHSPEALDGVDLVYVGAAVLRLVHASEAKRLLNGAFRETLRGFSVGQVAGNESYLFKGKFVPVFDDVSELEVTR